MISPVPDLPTDIIQQTFIQQEDRAQIDLQIKSHKSKASSRRLVEKPEKPIEVLSDEEEEQIISQKFQEEVFRAKIEEAKLTKSKQTILKCLYIELNFRDKKDHEKENRFNSMVQMYISKNLKTSLGKPFDIRTSYFFNQMAPKSGQSFVQNEYLLYGCDLLPHKYIEKRFQSFTPSIKWIDASHCRLTFMSKIQGWDAVISNCLDFDYLKRYILANEKVQLLLDKLELQNDKQMEEQYESKYTEEYFKLQKFKKEYHVLKGTLFDKLEFIELEPYYEMGFKRRLFIRNVTSSEQLIGYDLSFQNKSIKSQKSVKAINQEIKKPESDYKKYLRVKQALWREIQNSKFVKPEYEKIQKQIFRQKQILWLNKRPVTNNQNKQYGRNNQNLNQRNQNYHPRGNFRKGYHQMTPHYETYSQMNSQHSHQYQQRNRSRDRFFQQRHNMREGQSYRGRNSYGHGHNKFAYRTDQLQRAFDNYIERRDEIRVIENPQKYLQPEFVDKRTGLHFYRNPFYNPPIQAQFSYYNYQQEPGEYETPTPAYDYGSQSINNTNLSDYQYDGNVDSNQNLHSSRCSQDQVNIKNQRNHKKHFLGPQNKNPTQQEQFNTYCAQRDNIITQGVTNKKGIQSIRNKNQLSNLQQQKLNVPFLEASDFSIITEQKPHNKQRQQHVIEQNLENILDQIHEDQRSVISIKNDKKQQSPLNDNQKQPINIYENDDDSQDLEFMLRARENQLIKCEVKQEIQSKRIQNNQTGFIEEKIKQEHIPNWMNSSPVVDDVEESQQVTCLAISNQNGSQTHSYLQSIESSYPGKATSGNTQNMKKKIPVKKNRDSSNSRPKKSGHSLTKKQDN